MAQDCLSAGAVVQLVLVTCPVTDAGAVSCRCCGRPLSLKPHSPLSASVRIRLDPLPLSADVLYG